MRRMSLGAIVVGVAVLAVPACSSSSDGAHGTTAPVAPQSTASPAGPVTSAPTTGSATVPGSATAPLPSPGSAAPSPGSTATPIPSTPAGAEPPVSDPGPADPSTARSCADIVVVTMADVRNGCEAGGATVPMHLVPCEDGGAFAWNETGSGYVDGPAWTPSAVPLDAPPDGALSSCRLLDRIEANLDQFDPSAPIDPSVDEFDATGGAGPAA